MTFSYVFTYFLITLVCGSIGMVILGQLSTDMGTEQEIGAFRSFIIGVLVFTFSNTVWVWINYGYLNIPGWPFSMANLIAICVASYYWFKYIELRLNPELVATIQFRVASMLPLAIAIALVLTTPFTGLVFSYEGNEYIHGPLYSTMAVLALLYLIVATVHIATKVSKVHSPSQRSQYRTLMLFLLFPMMGGIIDVIVPNLPVMELMLLFGTVLVYTNMQQTQINSDVLTGLNNRRVTDEYLLGELEHVSKENPLCFFIGDIDRFKYINDQYGHIEGDHALRLVARALKESTGEIPCLISRWGGDEFVIIVRGRRFDDPGVIPNAVNDRLADLAKQEGASYPLRLSFGYVECTSPDMRPSEILARADQFMYKNKEKAREDSGAA